MSPKMVTNDRDEALSNSGESVFKMKIMVHSIPCHVLFFGGIATIRGLIFATNSAVILPGSIST